MDISKNDTITLTQIVDQSLNNKNKVYNFDDLKLEIDQIKKSLDKQNIILNTILEKLS